MANQVVLVGNLTDDGEYFQRDEGTDVVRFGLAYNNRYKDQEGNWQNGQASFFRLSAFGPLAEKMYHLLGTGDRVVVVGSLRQGRWQAEDGSNRQAVDVIVDHVGQDVRFQEVG